MTRLRHGYLNIYRNRKVGFLAPKTSTNWKHCNTTDYSVFWMKELPRAQGWDMNKSDLPAPSHMGPQPPLCGTHRGRGPSSTSLHDPLWVMGLPLPHRVPWGRLTLNQEQESPARRRWMELHPLWELGFPLLCCLLLLDCSGDAAGKLLASLLRICWLSSDPPCKVPTCLQRRSE